MWPLEMRLYSFRTSLFVIKSVSDPSLPPCAQWARFKPKRLPQDGKAVTSAGRQAQQDVLDKLWSGACRRPHALLCCGQPTRPDDVALHHCISAGLTVPCGFCVLKCGGCDFQLSTPEPRPRKCSEALTVTLPWHVSNFCKTQNYQVCDKPPGCALSAAQWRHDTSN